MSFIKLKCESRNWIGILPLLRQGKKPLRSISVECTLGTFHLPSLPLTPFLCERSALLFGALLPLATSFGELLNETWMLLLVRFFLLLSPLGLQDFMIPGMNHVFLIAFKLIPKLRQTISGRARSSLNILVSGTSFLKDKEGVAPLSIDWDSRWIDAIVVYYTLSIIEGIFLFINARFDRLRPSFQPSCGFFQFLYIIAEGETVPLLREGQRYHALPCS